MHTRLRLAPGKARAHTLQLLAQSDGGPAGRTFEWEAEVVAQTPNESIEWRSEGDSSVQHAGVVRFAPAPGMRGTEVRVEMRYGVPGGKLGAGTAKLLGSDPAQQVKDDLRRFKQMLETGEIVRSQSTPEGAGGRTYPGQRPAQPAAATEAASAETGSQ